MDGDSKTKVVIVGSTAGMQALDMVTQDLATAFAAPTASESSVIELMASFVSCAQSGAHALKEGGFPEFAYGMSKLGVMALAKIWSRTGKVTQRQT